MWKHVRDEGERFWSKVQKAEGDACWIWQGVINRHGYGAFRRTRGPSIEAHRMAYILEHGEIQDGRHVCHTCDNPACVRPDHLFLGTPKENMQDRSKKGRSASRVGEKNNNAKLTEEDVRQIHALKNAGFSNDSIASRYGVKPSHITLISSGQRWPHIHKELTENKDSSPGEAS